MNLLAIFIILWVLSIIYFIIGANIAIKKSNYIHMFIATIIISICIIGIDLTKWMGIK